MGELDKKKRKKRKGYRKVYKQEDDAGNIIPSKTEYGRIKQVGTYRPKLGIKKFKETSVNYKDGDSPRTRWTSKYVVKKRKDGTIKSEKNIIRKNFKIIKDTKVKRKVTYNKDGSIRKNK